MLTVRGSSALDPVEKQFQWAARAADEDNLDWVRRQLDALGHNPKGPKATWLLLVGGTWIYDFRLMVAQSHLRHDMTPSHWSHAALISTVHTPTGESRLLETSLDPQEGFQMPSTYNGVQGATLDRYGDPELYPNIALIRVPVDPALWRGDLENQKSILGQFAEQRVAVDVPSLILEWLAFVWGAGASGNPILSGHGIPSAAVIESLIGAAGYDLCPGLDSAASSPEAFWQTAKWWQASVEALNIEPLQTRYFINGHDPADADADATPPARKRPAAKRGAPAKKATATKKAAAAKKTAASKRAASETADISDLIRTPAPPRFRQASQLTRELFRRQ